MSLKHGILGLLNYRSMTGYDLMKKINVSLSFFWNAQTSQIYRELDVIEKKGWVTSEYVIQEGKPNKKIYTLSEEGHLELKRWHNEHTIDNLVKIRDEMTLRIFFASEGDEKILLNELIKYKTYNEIFVNSLKEAENQLDEHQKSVSKENEKMYWFMAVKRGYHTAMANINWVDECIEMLQSESL